MRGDGLTQPRSAGDPPPGLRAYSSPPAAKQEAEHQRGRQHRAGIGCSRAEFRLQSRRKRCDRRDDPEYDWRQRQRVEHGGPAESATQQPQHPFMLAFGRRQRVGTRRDALLFGDACLQSRVKVGRRDSARHG
ncbi:MAG: hypothetical protein IPJ97_06170 [Proteobacteria bacterium]|nr:hypothetical protein [Pseudomonadota bacterium]